ncbi:siderophore-interacting protein [Sphingobacterium sp. SYP-B4668]|uniref:siderophore-interacting protein n=1 Tax=Sphingobacterium sp. SYP-B4668 TaxID=2996035 RepID=UPI0022DD3B3A|nr:siderophore-interacting protein [Sphingobacterium sp. SYP-B4668]
MISNIPKWAGGLLESLVGQRAEVIATIHLSPYLKKVRFQANISRMNFQVGYASVIRVNETAYRNYTVAYHDSRAGILDIIFHIHGNGPGSEYAHSLRVGDQLYISSPRGHKVYDPRKQRQFLFGDETSLGLACSLLPFLKENKHTFAFYFELDDINKNVPASLGLENYSIYPKNQLFSDEERVRELPICVDSDWIDANFVLTGNVKAIQTFRKVLKNNGASHLYAQGYWLQGKKGL